MEDRTKMVISPVSPQVTHRESIIMLGSCFAEVIGQRLYDRLFKVLVNPFGTIYNPVSIAHLIDSALNGLKIDEDGFVRYDDQVLHYMAHSQVRADSKEGYISIMGHLKQQFKQFICDSSYVFITLGSANVFTMRNSGKVVANCHKQPQQLFDRRMLTIEEIDIALRSIDDNIKSYNPSARLVFQVSPVRHIRDGLVINNRSKARLIESIHRRVNAGTAEYFPSYELVLDDLRDYRYYNTDMTHPNELAHEYVWRNFSSCFMDQETLSLVGRIEAIARGQAHRPFNPNSQSHRDFLNKLALQIDTLKKEHPHLNFDQLP